jgi:uncharacterized protein (UPF0335 family)
MKVGHNSIAVEQLKSVIQRLENLGDEKDRVSADIKDVMAEAKGNGLDPKAIKTIIKLRKLDAQEREEQEATLETYLRAMGMISEEAEAV